MYIGASFTAVDSYDAGMHPDADGYPIKTRHYRPTPELTPRTEPDTTPVPLPPTRVLVGRPRQPRLVASAGGPVDRLLLTIPAYAAALPDEPLATAYRDLLAKLPAETQVVVLTHQSVAETVTGWRDDMEVVVTADDEIFSVWAEDAYVALTDRGVGQATTYLVEPRDFRRAGDVMIADLVCEADPTIRHTQAPLHFQGGNLLIGDDFFLIGADYPAISLGYVGEVVRPRPGERPEELIRRLYGEYLDTTRRLLYVGSTLPVPAEQRRPVTIGGDSWEEVVYRGNGEGTVQPIFHIDMFITPAGRAADGRYRLLVGDPRMAAELLGRSPSPYAMVEVFDDIAAGLAGEGFDVIRNPLPLAYVDDPAQRERLWYFATGNNVLISGDTVYLPTYGHGSWAELVATDEANERVWKNLGYHVQPLADFHPFAENLGAVHCIKKYLVRRD